MKNAPKPLKDLWSELVDRRLWPVALLLVVAIAAVPVLLSSGSSAEPGSGAPSSSVAGAGGRGPDKLAVADTEVVATTASGRGLGKARNPFVQRGARKKAGSSSSSSTTGGPGLSSAAGGSNNEPGGPSPGGPSGNLDPSGTTPGPGPGPSSGLGPKPTYTAASIRVRFGRVENDRKLRSVSRLQPLPDATNPVLVYLGVRRGTNTAVFLVSSDTQAEGDGSCKPRPASCQTVWIKEGGTEFFDVTTDAGTVVQYQLDVVDVSYRQVRSKAAAAASFLKVSGGQANGEKPPKPAELSPGRTRKGPGLRLDDVAWAPAWQSAVEMPAAGADGAVR